MFSCCLRIRSLFFLCRQGLDSGSNDMIVKPFEAEMLKEKAGILGQFEFGVARFGYLSHVRFVDSNQQQIRVFWTPRDR